MKVSWECHPKSPANLKKWRVEVIPSREEYSAEEVVGVELPMSQVAARTRRATIKLDIDLDSCPVRVVQVRVVGLDEYGSELRQRADDGREAQVVEGLSTEFWLDRDEAPEVEAKKRLDTVPTLGLGRLRYAMESGVDAIEESPGQWTDRGVQFYTVTLNGRRVLRLGASPALREIQTRILENEEGPGTFSARVDATQALTAEALEPVSVGDVFESLEATKKFLDRRRLLFRRIREQAPLALVETCDWDDDLVRRVRQYVAAYRELLEECVTAEQLTAVLSVDTVRLNVRHAREMERCVLTAPTHPLRLLWFAAHHTLLRDWEARVLSAPKQERKRAVDLELLERVAPLNCPAFVPSGDGRMLLFAQNLRFFWGISLPVDAPDPSRRIADIARLVGYEDEESAIADLPPSRLSEELRQYSKVHPYLHTVRLSLLNPGSGSFVADALREYYSGTMEDQDDDADSRRPLGAEVLAHFEDPLPSGLPPLSSLQADLYDSQPPGKRHYLNPFFSVSIRPIEQASSPTGGDVNITMSVDRLTPTLALVNRLDIEDSSSFFGLLMRLLPEFCVDSQGVRWVHRINLPVDAARQKHPSIPALTNELIDTHSSVIRATGRIIGEGSAGADTVGIVARLSALDTERLNAIHAVSDWVITLDRFFGVEFYDHGGAGTSDGAHERYLLDYSPEFLEGLGHRMLVTTGHREEVEETLGRAMSELGFALVEDSVGEVLQHLKTISGRLALRVLGDHGRAREAVSLGVVAAYLRAKGELDDSILVPVDAHPELFAPRSRKRTAPAQERCDLIRIRFKRGRLAAMFIEVKSRAVAGGGEDLFNRISDQIESTEQRFRELFFQRDPERLDHVLQRSRLASLLRFYLQRAARYGLISSPEQHGEMLAAIAKLEMGLPELSADRAAYIVSLGDRSRRPVIHNGVRIEYLSAGDFEGLDLRVSQHRPEAGEVPLGDLSRENVKEAVTTEKTGAGLSTRRVSPSDATPATSDSNAGPQGGGKSQPDRMQGNDVEHPTKRADAPTAVAFEGIVVGHSQGDEEPVLWSPSVQSSPHLFILGIPGQGKSVTVNRLLQQLSLRGVPAVVLDFHGSFTEASNPYVQAASPLVMDATQGLPFSPFEADPSRGGPGAGSWQTNCFAIAEIFAYVCDLGDMQKDVVYEAVRECYQDLGYADGKPERTPNISDVHRKIGVLEQQRSVRNVVARCRPLLELGLFSDQVDQHLPLDEILRRGLVLDVHRAGVEAMQIAAGAFLLRHIYKSMFSWPKAESLRMAIVLDEAHRLAKDTTLPKIMKEGRKFGVSVVVASQGLADFHPDVVENAGTKIVFRTNHPMSRKVAGFLRTRSGGELDKTIEQLGVGTAFVQTPDMANAARVSMLMPDSPGTVSSSQAELFASYQLIERLAHGGMAESYKATAASTRETVFLKRVRNESVESRSLQREIAIYSKLLRSEPRYIVRVLDVIDESGYTAVVTEFADGGDLEDHVLSSRGRRGLVPAEAKEIGAEILSALQELHGLEVVHRDLKPRNILRFGSQWKLADFGIAKNLSRLVSNHTFQQAGTFGYMAPEQLNGVEARASADVYSFGKLMVFLLTGQTDPDLVSFPMWRKLIGECTSSAAVDRPSTLELQEALARVPV